MQHTAITRREAHESIIPKAAARRQLILNTLGDKAMTAHELTDALLAQGHIRYYDRNYVSPRLTELKQAGMIQTVGRRVCPRTGKTVAVWQRVDAEDAI